MRYQLGRASPSAETDYRKLLSLKQKKQVINKAIEKLKKEEKSEINISLYNDPFETYYYPENIDRKYHQKQRQQIIMNELVSAANLKYLSALQEQLQEQNYILQQKLETINIQNQALQITAKYLQKQLSAKKQSRQKLFKKKKEVNRANIKTQTLDKKTKDTGTNFDISMSQKQADSEIVSKQAIKLKNGIKILTKTPCFSISIYENGNKFQNSGKKDDESRKMMNQSIQNDFKNTKKQANQKSVNKNYDQKQSYDNFRIPFNIQQQIYANLRQEYSYLDYLKANGKKSQIKAQKKKIQFLIEFFWTKASIYYGQDTRSLGIQLGQFSQLKQSEQ